MDDIKFDKNGYLTPPNLINSDLKTIKSIFVDKFSDSVTRQQLFANHIHFNNLLRNYLEDDFKQWIDGSFISQEVNPRDIDFLTFVDYRQYDQNEQAFNELRLYRLDRSRGVDAYFVKTYPENHHLYSNYQSDIIEWPYKFSTTRPYEPKGFIELTG